MNLIVTLKMAQGFTASEQFLANYILAETENVLKESIYELAKNTNTSTTSVIRLCKKLGFTGYKHFKIELARDYEQYLKSDHNINVNIPFKAHDSDIIISSKIAALSIETIRNTQSLLSEANLKKATKLLLTAKNIYGIGVSDPFIRLEDFRLKLLRINRYLKLIDLQAEQYHLTKNSSSRDIAIIVSNSGKTAEIVNDARLFYLNKTPIIAISKDKNSPLAKYSTVFFQLPNEDVGEFQVSNFSSQLAIEYLLNVLYSCIFNADFEQNILEEKNTPIAKF